MEWHECEITEVWVNCEGYTFRARGKRVIKQGWKELYGGAKDELLPELEKGCRLTVERAWSEQKFTKPPAAYTEGTIVEWMKKHGIGAASTRDSIVETLKARGYVVVRGKGKKKTLEPTEKGIELIRRLGKRPFASCEMTSAWERRLEAIRNGKEEYESFIGSIAEFVKREVDGLKGMSFSEASSIRCSCGGNVVKLRRVWKCSNCGKYLFEEVYGKKLDQHTIARLFGEEDVEVKGLKSRKGKRFNARLYLAQEDGKWRVKIRF